MTVVITIVACILIFGGIILVHELGHFLTAKKCGIQVNEFAMGMGPKLFSKKKGETVYSLRLFPIGGFVMMEDEMEQSENPRAFTNATVGKRMLVIVAGAVMNLLLGFIILTGMTIADGVIVTRTVAEFTENSLTEASGLEAGDKIVAVNGRYTFVYDDITYELARIKQDTADVTVERDGERVTLKDVSFDIRETEEGYRWLNPDFKVYGENINILNVTREALLQTLSLGRMVFISLVDIITGNAAVVDMSGPVGIVTVISQAAAVGLRPLVYIAALITVNVGIFNILPFPMLDGGRLVFLLIEAIRKKPVNQKYESVVHLVGFALMIMLMLFVTYNDITRLFK